MKNGCLHPVFGPKGTGWSIKNAIKVLAPDLPAYESLAIGNGSLAMLGTAEMLDPGTSSETAARIRADLLAYCAQDTLSMVMIYKTLRETEGVKMSDCQVRVTCGKCGYTTDDIWAVGGAVLDQGVLNVTVSCPSTHKLVDAEAGNLNDFTITDEDGSEHEPGKFEFDDFLDPVGTFMTSTICPECGENHPAWDAKLALCPVCGSGGCLMQ